MGQSSPLCAPFRVYKNMPLPKAPVLNTAQSLERGWEEKLLHSISQVRGHSGFDVSYKTWLKKNPHSLTEIERYGWLECVMSYIQQDTNGDGVPDWTAFVDGQPSQVLYPQDEDWDGDGIPNILDPEPFNKKIPTRNLSRVDIPLHLRSQSPQVYVLQKKIYKKFGILAIDHTDRHSVEVLKALDFLLSKGFSAEFIRNLKSIKYVYAFKGHDAENNIAAYHQQAHALSIGGELSYDDEFLKNNQSRAMFSSIRRIHLLAALAHEIGHAFLFEQLNAGELRTISEKYGSWGEVYKTDRIDTLLAEPFFRSHPQKFARTPALDETVLRENNFVSEYAFTNAHEWFADAFAAAILNRLGLQHQLGEDWHDLLVKKKSGQAYWANYNNISKSFMDWLQGAMERPR
jgi:hypothetical protein